MSNLVSMLYDTSVDEVARLREVRRLSSNGPPSKASAETILLGPGWGRRSQVSEHGKGMMNQFLSSRVLGESRQLDELISGEIRRSSCHSCCLLGVVSFVPGRTRRVYKKK